MPSRRRRIDSWAFAPPADEYDEEEEEEVVEPEPEKARPKQATRKRARRSMRIRRILTPYPPGRSGKRAERTATQEGAGRAGDLRGLLWKVGGPAAPQSPIRTRPSLDGLPASSDPRTPGGGLKEGVSEEEDEERRRGGVQSTAHGRRRP